MKYSSKHEWDADQEQYYLENPDEWPDAPEGWPGSVEQEPDDDYAQGDEEWYHDLDPWGEEDDDEWIVRHMNEHGLTAEGQDYLGNRDDEGDFV
jgi:hypothetical protein